MTAVHGDADERISHDRESHDQLADHGDTDERISHDRGSHDRLADHIARAHLCTPVT